MDRRELRLAPTPRSRPRLAGATVVGAAILAAAAWASLSGADRARAPFDPASIAERGLMAWLDGDGPGARSAALELRARLKRTPTDATTRTLYASLLAETATSGLEREAAAEQGRLAVSAAPHEEGVLAAAVKVMARTGQQEEAVATLRSLFAESPADAAVVLSEIEPFLPPDRVEAAIPALPEAWLARSARLREAGRVAEADRLLEALLARWPDDLSARLAAGEIAARRGDLDALARLVPPGLPLPEDREHAALVALRARTRATGGDGAGARADARRAVDLAPGSPSVAVAAGDALEGIDPGLARAYWTRGLFLLARSESTRRPRIAILLRLARLDEKDGRAGDALRHWREILELDEGHVEATRRIAALTKGV